MLEKLCFADFVSSGCGEWKLERNDATRGRMVGLVCFLTIAFLESTNITAISIGSHVRVVRDF